MKPSTEIRSNYPGISRLAKETGQPVYITKNGTDDMVIMDPESFSRREIELDMRQEQIDDAEKALRAKMRFLNGDKGLSVQESRRLSMEAIQKVDSRQKGTG